MAQGDRVLVVIDLGGGYTRDEDVVATVAGGYVQVVQAADWTTVTERKRPKAAPGQKPAFGEDVPTAPGDVVREVKVRADRIIALIETPK